MVAAFVRSELTDLPAPAAEVDPPPAADNGRDNNDPWRNVFRRVGARNNYGAYMYNHLLPPQPDPNHYGLPQAPGGAGPNGGEADRQQMGWFDMEDGGIYRCVDCYHEIWEGVCASCNRRYPGHNYLDDDDDDDIRFDDSDDDDEDDDGYDGHFRGGIGRFMEAIMNDEDGFDDDDEEEDLDLGLLEVLEEEIEAREEALRHLREAEEQDGHWPNYDRDVVAMLGEHIGDEDEDEDPDYDEQPWYDRPVRRRQRRGARIEEVDDDDGEGEEDSQYGGSFIDDQAVEEHDHELAVNDEDGSEDEVEFVEPPRQHHTRRRPHVVVESTDDEDESEAEAENPRVLIRQLARGTRLGRLQPLVAARADRYVELSEDEEDDDGSDIHLTDNGELEVAENDISEEEPEEESILHTRSGRPIRRSVFYEDSDS